MTTSLEKPLRLVVLGEGNMGKTSLVRSLATDSQIQSMGALTSTIGVDFCIRNFTDKKTDETIQLQIFDTAGQEMYAPMCRSYYRQAECALLVFELFNPLAWKRAEAWFHEVREHDPNVGIVFVGTKSDLVPTLTREQTLNWAMVWEQAREFTDSHSSTGVVLVPTSTVTGEGVDEVVTAAIKNARAYRSSSLQQYTGDDSSTTLLLLESAPVAEEDGRLRIRDRCCT